jgi:hypothetical protein
MRSSRTFDSPAAIGLISIAFLLRRAARDCLKDSTGVAGLAKFTQEEIRHFSNLGPFLLLNSFSVLQSHPRFWDKNIPVTEEPSVHDESNRS